MSTEYPASRHQREPWNKGRLVGQKRPAEAEGCLDHSSKRCETHCFDAARGSRPIDGLKEQPQKQ